MREGEVEKQLKLLDQQISMAGEELEALRRDQRAGMDALRLEVETLRRCLRLLNPDSDECFSEVRAEVLQETDPEAL